MKSRRTILVGVAMALITSVSLAAAWASTQQDTEIDGYVQYSGLTPDANDPPAYHITGPNSIGLLFVWTGFNEEECPYMEVYCEATLTKWNYSTSTWETTPYITKSQVIQTEGSGYYQTSMSTFAPTSEHDPYYCRFRMRLSYFSETDLEIIDEVDIPVYVHAPF